MPKNGSRVQSAFALAKEQYGQSGVNVEQALAQLAQIPISLHCWQVDDVGGFENAGAAVGGGLAVTGDYAGTAGDPDELAGPPATRSPKLVLLTYDSPTAAKTLPQIGEDRTNDCLNRWTRFLPKKSISNSTSIQSSPNFSASVRKVT